MYQLLSSDPDTQFSLWLYSIDTYQLSVCRCWIKPNRWQMQCGLLHIIVLLVCGIIFQHRLLFHISHLKGSHVTSDAWLHQKFLYSFFISLRVDFNYTPCHDELRPCILYHVLFLSENGGIGFGYFVPRPSRGKIPCQRKDLTYTAAKWWQETNKANLRDLIAATGLVILLKLDSNHQFFSPCDLEIWRMTFKNKRAPLLCYKVCASFQCHRLIQTGVTVRKRLIWVKIDIWPWKTIGHLFYTTSSFLYNFVTIREFKLELQSGNAQSGSISTIFSTVWPWNLPDDLAKQ